MRPWATITRSCRKYMPPTCNGVLLVVGHNLEGGIGLAVRAQGKEEDLGALATCST